VLSPDVQLHVITRTNLNGPQFEHFTFGAAVFKMAAFYNLDEPLARLAKILD